jgi:hypothetical protein
MSRKGSRKEGKTKQEFIVAYPKKGESIEDAVARVQRNHPGDRVVAGKPHAPHTSNS